jgi:hypothetical protein
VTTAEMITAAVIIVGAAAVTMGMITAAPVVEEMMTMMTETRAKRDLFLSYPKDNRVFIPVNLLQA